MKVPSRILPIIVLSQFFCTSLWFAGNGVMQNLILEFGLRESHLGHITSAVQFGFITGTLLYALLTISDRYSPSKVFFTSAILGGIANLGILWSSGNLSIILMFRFMTGFFLAGIYPVGMKIAADYFIKGLGKSLGYLVGALVLGTALPHLLSELFAQVSWHYVIVSTSSLAFAGGSLIMLFVPDGPYRTKGSGIDLSLIFKIFKNLKLRKVAFGYFGHMWELYAFWTFVPIILSDYINHSIYDNISISGWSFIVIAVGSIACVIGGYISQKFGNLKTAMVALSISGLCCLLSPLMLSQDYLFVLLIFMIVWGMAVIADSPQLSTMVANSVDSEIKGSTLTIVNCIGFSITIISIEFLNYMRQYVELQYLFLFLVIGPLMGLFYLKGKTAQE